MSPNERTADARRRLAKLLKREQRLKTGHSRMSARQLLRTQHKIAYLRNVLAG